MFQGALQEHTWLKTYAKIMEKQLGTLYQRVMLSNSGEIRSW